MAATLAAITTPAFAQVAEAPDEEALRQELAEMRAQMAQMAARMEALEASLAETNAVAQDASEQIADAVDTGQSTPGQTIEFKGMPQITDKSGWSFKPRGRLQFDAGTIDVPGSTGRGGFGGETRRARLGASGDLPGGFGYKFEFDFAASQLTVTDAIISYETGDAEILVGQFNTFQGLEELTSSVHTSFIERSAFTDAFVFERRVGAALVINSGDILVQTGAFTDNMIDLPGTKNWSLDSRVVYMPKIGETQLHLGGSIHYNELQGGSTVRYRQRPLVHFTADRFINTDRLDADNEFGLGLESAIISGPFHAAAEVYWQNVGLSAGMQDPTFFGGSIEAGYFLTKGDTRGYKSGTFDRSKPASAVDDGGFGSLQVNLRYDRLDLNDAGIIGGTQDGYMASLVWKPTDYTMLLANYAHLEYGDAAFPTGTGSRDYAADIIAMRAQIDF
ncbi:porin [Erythrobacter insulae]|nr:porin [Erythrobacter insulae]